MKGYKGSNKRMTKNYTIDHVFDMSASLKKLLTEKGTTEMAFVQLTYDDLQNKQGEIVYVLYPNRTVDKAVIYDADENDITFWGSYDNNGDAIIAIVPKKQYGAMAQAIIAVDEPPVKANKAILEEMNFPDYCIKTVMEHIA